MNEDRLASAICGALLTLGLAFAAALGFWSAPSLLLFLAFLCAILALTIGWGVNGATSEGHDVTALAWLCIGTAVVSAVLLAIAMIGRIP